MGQPHWWSEFRSKYLAPGALAVGGFGCLGLWFSVTNYHAEAVRSWVLFSFSTLLLAWAAWSAIAKIGWAWWARLIGTALVANALLRVCGDGLSAKGQSAAEVDGPRTARQPPPPEIKVSAWEPSKLDIPTSCINGGQVTWLTGMPDGGIASTYSSRFKDHVLLFDNNAGDVMKDISVKVQFPCGVELICVMEDHGLRVEIRTAAYDPYDPLARFMVDIPELPSLSRVAILIRSDTNSWESDDVGKEEIPYYIYGLFNYEGSGSKPRALFVALMPELTSQDVKSGDTSVGPLPVPLGEPLPPAGSFGFTSGSFGFGLVPPAHRRYLCHH